MPVSGSCFGFGQLISLIADATGATSAPPPCALRSYLLLSPPLHRCTCSSLLQTGPIIGDEVINMLEDVATFCAEDDFVNGKYDTIDPDTKARCSLSLEGEDGWL